MKRCVTMLRMEEPARFNPDRLEQLCAEIGERRAEREVALALEAISADLQNLSGVDASQTPEALSAPVRSIVTAAEMIGMASLARVGWDVLACLERGDPVSLAATHSRLARVGERSINAIWDLEDLSG